MPMWGYICFTNRYKGTYFYFTLRGAILLMLLGWYWRSETNKVGRESLLTYCY